METGTPLVVPYEREEPSAAFAHPLDRGLVLGRGDTSLDEAVDIDVDRHLETSVEKGRDIPTRRSNDLLVGVEEDVEVLRLSWPLTVPDRSTGGVACFQIGRAHV